MARKHRFESPSLQYLYDKHIGKNERLQAVFEDELVNAELARELYELRKEAKLPQSELARLARTTASVISRLEDPSYRGHSLSMVSRIARILGKNIQVKFVPSRRSSATSALRKKATGRKQVDRSKTK